MIRRYLTLFHLTEISNAPLTPLQVLLMWVEKMCLPGGSLIEIHV